MLAYSATILHSTDGWKSRVVPTGPKLIYVSCKSKKRECFSCKQIEFIQLRFVNIPRGLSTFDWVVFMHAKLHWMSVKRSWAIDTMRVRTVKISNITYLFFYLGRSHFFCYECPMSKSGSERHILSYSHTWERDSYLVCMQSILFIKFRILFFFLALWKIEACAKQHAHQEKYEENCLGALNGRYYYARVCGGLHILMRFPLLNSDT